MLTKTSTFCQIMPEKNQFKETYPLKKGKKTPKFVHFKNLYPLLLRLCRPQDVIPKLKKHKLANGPHLRSPQQCLEVSQDSYFRSNKLLLSDQRCERPCTFLRPSSRTSCVRIKARNEIRSCILAASYQYALDFRLYSELGLRLRHNHQLQLFHN